jgi:hypothetical protein
MTVNEVGDHTQPLVSVNGWKTLVGENVPVTYRFWKGKKHMRKNTLLQTSSNKIYGIS